MKGNPAVYPPLIVVGEIIGAVLGFLISGFNWGIIILAAMFGGMAGFLVALLLEKLGGRKYGRD